MINFALFLGFAAGIVAAGVTFIFNSQTPLHLGPIPFFTGAALALACLIALIARIATGN